MIIQSKRVGTIEVKEDRIIHFQNGILGFPDLKRFIIADDPADISMPFKWLISVENPETVFLITDPGIFFKDYVFDLPESERQAIGVKSEDDVSVITILTVPADPKKITANLRGPLVINWKTLIGRQVILENTSYTTKHFIFVQAKAQPAAEAPKTSDVGLSSFGVPLTKNENGEVEVSYKR